MKAVLTLEYPDSEGRVVRRIVKLADGTGTVGSGEACELQVEGLPELAMSIASRERAFFITTSTDLFHNDAPLTAGSEVELRNGDDLRFGKDVVVTFNVEFERTGQNRRAGVLPGISVALIAILLLVEVGVGAWLPYAVRRPAQWGLEITQQRTFALLDRLRVDLRYDLANNPDLDSRTRTTQQLIVEEVNRISLYLREHEETLNAEQLNQTYQDLMAFYQTFRELRQTSFYPDRQELAIDQVLEQILQEQP